MPRKTSVARPSAAASPLAVMTNSIVFQTSNVVKLNAIQTGVRLNTIQTGVKLHAKRSLVELESFGSLPAIQLGTPAVEANKRLKQVSLCPDVIPSLGVAPYTYYDLQHASNPRQLFLVITGGAGGKGIKVFFVGFPFMEFYYSATAMPDLHFLPHDADVKHEYTPWWLGAGGVEVITRSLPMPAAGFSVGDFVSFPGSRDSFGKVLFVFIRGNGQHLYFIAAEKDQRRRLLMETLPHVSGPELGFVKPRTCWFDPHVFPAIHVGAPNLYDYFEVPMGGFHLKDPVTVFSPDTRRPLDGEISFITSTPKYVLPIEYGVKVLSTGEQLVFKYDQVFGARIGRFTPCLCTGLVSAPPSRSKGIITVEEVSEIGTLGPDWEMEEEEPVQPVVVASSPGVSLPHTSFPATPPVTPVREMTRLSVRPNHQHVQFVDFPWPGALLARECARQGALAAKDDA